MVSQHVHPVLLVRNAWNKVDVSRNDAMISDSMDGPVDTTCDLDIIESMRCTDNSNESSLNLLLSMSDEDIKLRLSSSGEEIERISPLHSPLSQSSPIHTTNMLKVLTVIIVHV